MRWAHVSIAAATLGALGGVSGCTHCCKNPAPAVPPPVYGAPPGRPGGDLLLPAPIPPASQPPPPGGSVVPPGNVLPPGSAPPPGGANPFPPAGTSRFGYSPGLILGPPTVSPYQQSSPALSVPNPGAGVQFGQPQFRNDPSLPPAGATAPAGGSPASPFPSGIPGFSRVNERVASGLKPFPEGYDWLRANGYRSVLFIRPPGSDDGEERRQTEQRGLTYRSLELSAGTLTDQVVSDFNRAVTDPASQPLFVYDADGTLAGALWYLYFRTAERAGDDVARLRAGRLGLREDGSDEQTALWLAIQKYLARRPMP
jgi:protein tyrosine phosphatase (PTP) superfamily phosphohydrolase (DUF442 family)